MADKIYVNDTGIPFRGSLKDADGAAIDLTDATVVKMWFEKPGVDGEGPVVVEFDASVVSPPTSGTIQYITQNGDLDRAGSWRVQAYALVGAIRIHTDIQKFKVLANLKSDPS